MPRWYWLPMPPTPLTRPFPICSCKPNLSLTAALSCHTAPRDRPADHELWAAHIAVVEGEAVGVSQFETDRARFLGRGRGIRTPVAVIDGRPLSNTAGAVLDPIFSLRRRIRLAPGKTARVAFWTMVAPSRGEVLDLADKHHEPAAFERAITLAWTQAQVQLYHLGIDSNEANLFQRLAGHFLFQPCAATLAGGAAHETSSGARPSGLTASRATCRSFWLASLTRKALKQSASYCVPTSIGG